MVEQDAREDTVDAFVEDVPWDIAALLRADDGGHKIHGCAAEEAARLRPDGRVREQAVELSVDGLEHGGEVDVQPFSRRNREAAADIEIGQVHAGGFGLKEKVMNEQQRFFVRCGGQGLAADVEADALGVESGLFGLAQERQGLIERCAELRIEVDERLAVVDLHAHEDIGAGRRGSEFGNLAGIIERKAADAETGGRRKTACIVDRIGVDHA